MSTRHWNNLYFFFVFAFHISVNQRKQFQVLQCLNLNGIFCCVIFFFNLNYVFVQWEIIKRQSDNSFIILRMLYLLIYNQLTSGQIWKSLLPHIMKKSTHNVYIHTSLKKNDNFLNWRYCYQMTKITKRIESEIVQVSMNVRLCVCVCVCIHFFCTQFENWNMCCVHSYFKNKMNL